MASEELALAEDQLRIELTEALKTILVELALNDSFRYDDNLDAPSPSALRDFIKASSLDHGIHQVVNLIVTKKELVLQTPMPNDRDSILTNDDEEIDANDDEEIDEEIDANDDEEIDAYHEGVDTLLTLLIDVGFVTLANLRSDHYEHLIRPLREAILKYRSAVLKESTE